MKRECLYQQRYAIKVTALILNATLFPFPPLAMHFMSPSNPLLLRSVPIA